MQKHYHFESIEKKWKESFAQVSRKKSSKKYTLLMPPPNITGSLHLGHALDNFCSDLLARYYQLKGYELRWIPGQDHAGISTQALVEKLLFEEEKKTRQELGREEFLKKLWNWKEHYAQAIIEDFKNLGLSCDWNEFLFTLDEDVILAVNTLFKKLFDDGLIYQKETLVNWDTTLETAISDIEVTYKKVNSFFYFINYPLVNNPKEFITIATTRPETIFADVAIIFHPEDKRYLHLLHEEVFIPLINKKIPILSHPDVDPEKGTGLLKITPQHDFKDFSIAQDLNLSLGSQLLSSKGIFTEEAHFLKGLNLVQARKKMEESLGEYLVEKTPHLQEVPHSERSQTIIEPRISKQWYLKIKPLAEKTLKLVDQEQTQFYSPQWKNSFFSWMENIHDWCLSRQLWWGHPIPIVTCLSCGHQEAYIKEATKCSKCSHQALKKEEDVFDTWFSSGLWPLVTLGWPNKMKEKDFKERYPFDVVSPAHDIIFFWVARMMMLSSYITGKLPFKSIYFHGLVCDAQGRKMSKSLNNGVNIPDTLKRHGVDALRLTLLKDCGYQRFFSFQEKNLELSRNFLNKLWHIFYFIEPYKNVNLNFNDLSQMDKWILLELKILSEKYDFYLKNYRFDEIFKLLEYFLYETFSHFFIEFSKKDIQAHGPTLTFVLEEILKYFHPFIPFLTQELWSQLHHDDLILSKDFRMIPELSSTFYPNLEVLKGLRSLRHLAGLSPKEEAQAYLSSQEVIDYSFLKEQTKTHFLSQKEKRNFYFTKKISFGVLFLEVSEEVFLQVQDRMKKETSKLEKELEETTKKLSNEKILERATPEYIEDLKTRKEQLLFQLQELNELFTRE